MTNKDNYKILAKYYDLFLWGNYKKYWEIINVISNRFINESKKINILDIWCWTWWILDYIWNSNLVDWIDLSDEMLNIAKKNHPNNNFYKMSFEDISLDENYNFIFSIFDTLNHIKDQSTLNKVLLNVSNLLNKWWVFFFDINTLYKFKSFKSDKFSIIKDGQNELLTVSREYIPPNIWKWNIEILSKRDWIEWCSGKIKTEINEISFDLESLYIKLKNLYSTVYLFDLDDLNIDLNVTIKSISKSGKISRLWFLCIK